MEQLCGRSGRQQPSAAATRGSRGDTRRISYQTTRQQTGLASLGKRHSGSAAQERERKRGARLANRRTRHAGGLTPLASEACSCGERWADHDEPHFLMHKRPSNTHRSEAPLQPIRVLFCPGTSATTAAATPGHLTSTPAWPAHPPHTPGRHTETCTETCKHFRVARDGCQGASPCDDRPASSQWPHPRDPPPRQPRGAARSSPRPRRRVDGKGMARSVDEVRERRARLLRQHPGQRHGVGEVRVGRHAGARHLVGRQQLRRTTSTRGSTRKESGERKRERESVKASNKALRPPVTVRAAA